MEDEKVLDVASRDVCTTVSMYLMSLNCTIKNGKFYAYFTYVLPQFTKGGKKLLLGKTDKVYEELICIISYNCRRINNDLKNFH